MATEPYSADELQLRRARCDMDEKSPAHNVEEARWFATIDAIRAEFKKLQELEEVTQELRKLLVESVPEDLICLAETGCPSCGDTMTARLGTELKLQRDKALERVRDADIVIDHARGFFKSYETEWALRKYDLLWKSKK